MAGGTTGTQGPERSRCGFCPDERLLFARAKFRMPRARVGFFRIIALLSRDSSGGRPWERSLSYRCVRAHGVYSGLRPAPRPVGPAQGATPVFCCALREAHSWGRTVWRLLLDVCPIFTEQVRFNRHNRDTSPLLNEFYRTVKLHTDDTKNTRHIQQHFNNRMTLAILTAVMIICVNICTQKRTAIEPKHEADSGQPAHKVSANILSTLDILNVEFIFLEQQAPSHQAAV